MEEFFKNYVKQLVDNTPENMGYGNKFTFAIQYTDEKGNPITEPLTICEITKNDLDENL